MRDIDRIVRGALCCCLLLQVAASLAGNPCPVGTDADGDGVCDDVDNCPTIPNGPQPNPEILPFEACEGSIIDGEAFRFLDGGATLVYRGPWMGGPACRLMALDLTTLEERPLSLGEIGPFVDIAPDESVALYEDVANDRGLVASQLPAGTLRPPLGGFGPPLGYRTDAPGFWLRRGLAIVTASTFGITEEVFATNVADHRLTRDGSVIVFRRRDSDQLERIGEAEPLFSPVSRFELTRDGQMLVIVPPREDGDPDQLWSRPVEGGDVIDLGLVTFPEEELISIDVDSPGYVVVSLRRSLEGGSTSRLWFGTLDGAGEQASILVPHEWVIVQDELVYRTDEGLFARSLPGGEERSLFTGRVVALHAAPGSSVVYFQERTTQARFRLYRVDLQVDVVERIDNAPSSRLGDVRFSPDGATAFHTLDGDGLARVPVSGGSSEFLLAQVADFTFAPSQTEIFAARTNGEIVRLDLHAAAPGPGAEDRDLDGLGAACDCNDLAPGCADICVDEDGDGFDVCAEDCNDFDPAAGPGFDEICDESDNDCDGFVDEIAQDRDADGITTCQGDCDDLDDLCAAECIDADQDGVFVCAGDCDDDDPAVGLFVEICDGLDNDCDGTVDELDTDIDEDGISICDGDCYDLSANCQFNCIDEDLDGVPVCGGDCDDADPSIRPGANEPCDLIDNDCDGEVDEPSIYDRDDDGVTVCAGDCDDLNPLCRSEDCTDADGDGACSDTDCDDLDPGVSPQDFDLDGLSACDGDCDDTNPLCGTDCTDADGDDVCAMFDCDDSDELLNPLDVDGDGLTSCDGDCDDADPFCEGSCADEDGDGVCFDADCDDADAGDDEGCPPRSLEITSLRAVPGFVFEWDPLPFAEFYEVAAVASGGICVLAEAFDEGIETEPSDPTIPLTVFLVRARSSTSGPWGFDSLGNRRVVPCADP